MRPSKHEERKEPCPVIGLTNLRRTSQGQPAAAGSSRPSSVRVLLPRLPVLWFHGSAPAPPRAPGATVWRGALRASVVTRRPRPAVVRRRAATPPPRRAVMGRAAPLVPARNAASVPRVVAPTPNAVRRPTVTPPTAVRRPRSARRPGAACSASRRSASPLRRGRSIRTAVKASAARLVGESVRFSLTWMGR